MREYQNLPGVDFHNVGVYSLTEAERKCAGRQAHYLLARHGYWMTLYHCTTMMIWCRKYKPHWSAEDSVNVYYWREVRNIAFKNTYRS